MWPVTSKCSRSLWFIRFAMGVGKRANATTAAPAVLQGATWCLYPSNARVLTIINFHEGAMVSHPVLARQLARDCTCTQACDFWLQLISFAVTHLPIFSKLDLAQATGLLWAELPCRKAHPNHLHIQTKSHHKQIHWGNVVSHPPLLQGKCLISLQDISKCHVLKILQRNCPMKRQVASGISCNEHTCATGGTLPGALPSAPSGAKAVLRKLHMLHAPCTSVE